MSRGLAPALSDWYGRRTQSFHPWMRNLRQRIRKLRKAIIPWLLIITASVVLAGAILTAQPLKILAVVLSLIFAAIVFKRLEIGIVALMVMCAGFIHATGVPKVLTMGGHGFFANEALLLFMLVLVFCGSALRKEMPIFKSPVTLPMLLFFGVVAVALVEVYIRAGMELSENYSFRSSYNHVRPLFYYTLFFVVAFGIRTKEQIRLLLRLLIWLCVIVALMMVVQYFLGPRGASIFVGEEPWNPMVHATPDERSVARSTPPGLAPILILFFYVVAQASYSNVRWKTVSAGLAACVLGMGIVFSMTRQLWLIVPIALAIIWVLSAARVKRRLGMSVTTIAVLAVLGAMLIGGLASGTAGERFTIALQNRFLSAFKSETYIGPSMSNRSIENQHALEIIKQKPLTGIGLDKPIMYKESRARPRTWTKFFFPVYIIHNSYLELWAVYGLLGIFSFLWLSLVFLIRSFKLFRVAEEPEWKALSLALFVGYLAFMVKSVLGMTILHQIHDIVTIALMYGLVEALWRLKANESGREGMPDIVTETAGRAQ